MTGSESSWPRPAAAWYRVAVMMIACILSFIDRVLVGPIRAEVAAIATADRLAGRSS
ncbi:MAG TPA: hypothetical protein PKL49_00905 [Steroidobacteraceae bacterium]|nr:hypothetical protein [Steroidobacteraceae bacterium]HNS27500.1 hypothetical protein [Steroidobacteraceae bacterium]